jgi:hypothetical protein
MEKKVNEIEKQFQKETGTKRPLFWRMRFEASLLYINKYISWLEEKYAIRNNLSLEKDLLEKVGLAFVPTKLGENVFIHLHEIGLSHFLLSIRPNNWSVSQLRAIADYMEANPDCTLYSDGSGNKVRL